MNFRPTILGFTILGAALLSACGGGGGGSTPGGSIPPTGGGSPTATPTPGSGATATPSPSPTPTSVAPQYAGRVVSADNGNAPVSGATVTVGTGFVYNGTGYVLSGVTATTTTAANGTFSLASTGAQFVQVVASGLVAAHRPMVTTTNFGGYNSATFNTTNTFALPTASSDELGALATTNSDRAAHGSGAGAQAMSLDADLMNASRARATDMATQGYLSHIAPNTNYAAIGADVCNAGGFCGNPEYVLESITGGGSTFQTAEASYMSEGPGGAHYDQIVSKTNLFFGFGEALNGQPFAGWSQPTASYFVTGEMSSTGGPQD